MSRDIQVLLRWLEEGRFPKEEFRFTPDGWAAVGWISLVVMPPLAVGIGVWLRRRGDARGRPLFLAGLLVTAACVIAGLAMALT